MDAIQAIMSVVMTMFLFAMVIVTVWKLFQVSSELSEIKTILSDMRHPMPPVKQPVSPPIQSGPISLESAEALLREVAADSPKTTA